MTKKISKLVVGEENVVEGDEVVPTQLMTVIVPVLTHLVAVAQVAKGVNQARAVGVTQVEVIHHVVVLVVDLVGEVIHPIPQVGVEVIHPKIEPKVKVRKVGVHHPMIRAIEVNIGNKMWIKSRQMILKKMTVPHVHVRVHVQ